MLEIRFCHSASKNKTDRIRHSQESWSNNLKFRAWKNKTDSLKKFKINLEGENLIIDHVTFVKITSLMLDF